MDHNGDRFVCHGDSGSGHHSAVAVSMAQKADYGSLTGKGVKL